MDFIQENVPFSDSKIEAPDSKPMKRKISGSVSENFDPSIDESGEGRLVRMPELKTTTKANSGVKRSLPDFGNDELVKGIILSEILGKPKALRK